MSGCKECPWKRSNPHSLKWRKYSKKMQEVGITGELGHACHMKTSDVWGVKSAVTKETRCQGQSSSQSSSSS
jgi:hypothetical protein